MKKITQKEIAKTLKCEQATISRYLTNTRNITLKDANIVAKAHDLPIEVFIDANLQLEHFGKSFITDNSISNQSTKSTTQNEKGVA